MALTNADIVNSISDHCGCSKPQSLDLMKSEKIKEAPESGKYVLISRFGKFYMVKRKKEGSKSIDR